MLADAHREPLPDPSGVPQPLQVVEHALGGLVAVVRLLLQQMHDDLGQRPGHGRVHLGRRHRHPRQVIVGEPQRVAGTERRLARRQLVQRRAQRVQIGALIHRPAGTPGLLRRQIRQRPDDLGVVGELGTDLGERRRQREVHQARGAVAGDHDVRRSDVPVHHAPAVHPRHRPGQLHRQPDQLIDGQRLRQLRQARATDVLQHDRPRVPRRIQPAARPPSTPRSRSSIASSCRSRRSASGPSGSLRMTVRPAREQPRDPRALALVDYLRPSRQSSTQRRLASCHPTPRPTRTRNPGNTDSEEATRSPRPAASHSPLRILRSSPPS